MCILYTHTYMYIRTQYISYDIYIYKYISRYICTYICMLEDDARYIIYVYIYMYI